ncbi:hypothetical protein TH61_02910 [Rufibacter sp. DG15C]|uniref:transglutaminase domain-containing protein n=1 Tax=Rufibacter sp. DG15C TaxID=1379909 RepID=UPI00078B5C2A|nr:transglutaminase domain-containing protein [Rufibacter sp. DG15C]AMM50339.1 hypothetical protein TH61_02910 [Rufibacter sp. DG15C]
MKRFVLLLLSIFYAAASFAQKSVPYAAVDKKVIQLTQKQTMTLEELAKIISQHFTTPEERTRAAFVWLTENIVYDIQALYLTPPIGKNKYLVEQTLKTKKAVCEGYAEVFQTLCNRMGIKAYMVTGYTAVNNQISSQAHAWCAAQLNGKWFLFDPTWGAGYVTGKTFTKHRNEQYFKADPASLAPTHLPSDPLWQFSTAPITGREFATGVFSSSKPKNCFQFKDTLAAYEKLDDLGRLVSTVRRMEAPGNFQPFLGNHLQSLKQQIDYQNYLALSTAYNQGIDLLNQFLYYRNNMLFGRKREAELKTLITTSVCNFQSAKNKLDTVKWHSNKYEIGSIKDNLSQAYAMALDQQKFIQRIYNPLGLKKKN